MPREYDLQFLGIARSLNLEGELIILGQGTTLPVVFLFDEEHNNEDSLNKNLFNANELIQNGNVDFIGVESYSGGQVWDSNLNRYWEVEEEYDNGRINTSPVNIWPNFANGLRNCFRSIYGVECYFMMQQINDEIQNTDSEYYGIDIAEHPLNIKRSIHFIRTLFELRIRSNSIGNLILNCGRDHNTHIVEWIENGEIEEITGIQANYIRINTID